MTINTLIDQITKRVQELGDMSMDNLRATYPETTDTRSELVRHVKEMKLTRGEIMRDIISDEFSYDFDQDIESNVPHI